MSSHLRQQACRGLECVEASEPEYPAEATSLGGLIEIPIRRNPAMAVNMKPGQATRAASLHRH